MFNYRLISDLNSDVYVFFLSDKEDYGREMCLKYCRKMNTFYLKFGIYLTQFNLCSIIPNSYL